MPDKKILNPSSSGMDPAAVDKDFGALKDYLAERLRG